MKTNELAAMSSATISEINNFRTLALEKIRDLERQLAAGLDREAGMEVAINECQRQLHDRECPACKGEGFGPIGGKPHHPCGMCGKTGRL